MGISTSQSEAVVLDQKKVACPLQVMGKLRLLPHDQAPDKLRKMNGWKDDCDIIFSMIFSDKRMQLME